MQAENQRLQQQLELQKSLPEPGEEVESPEQRQRYKHVYQKLAANNEEIYKVRGPRCAGDAELLDFSPPQLPETAAPVL